ncbi:LacI family DNA-binding transcriptional regulator [Nocardioides maradonensis]
MTRPTLHDVARQAGVSTTTASDALSGRGRVSERTKDRVRAAAEELGFVPSSTAQHLRRARVGAIGLYLPELTTSMNYYTQVTSGCLRRVHEAGYDLTLLAPATADRSQGNPRVDGIVMIDPVAGDVTIEQLARARLPIVTGERSRRLDLDPAGVVRVDHEQVITTVLDHLAARGARRPVLLAPADGSDWAASLRRGHTRWCTAAGIEPTIATVAFAAGPDEITALVREILRNTPEVDAIVSAPDAAALGVAGAAAELGRTIGTDLLVASCVDSPAMELASPRITAVDLHPLEFGRACADLLVDLLEERAGRGEERVRGFDLVVRASTRG